MLGWSHQGLRRLGDLRQPDLDTVTEDFGERWTRITDGLPMESVNGFLEHPRAPNLLFAGNEVGAWVSFDRGGRWHRLEGHLASPPLAVLLEGEVAVVEQPVEEVAAVAEPEVKEVVEPASAVPEVVDLIVVVTPAPTVPATHQCIPTSVRDREIWMA